jgi:FKBP-type peptidyl-prolyl cis-trans isomerase FkpA
LRALKSKVMSRFFKAILVVTVGLLIFSCNQDDDSNGVKPEPYDEQYIKDLAKIDEFIDNHYMKVDPITFEVSFKKIQTHGADSLPIRTQTEYPLESRMVEIEDHEQTYKMYYIKFRQGTGEKPTRVDSTLVSYRGEYLYKKKVAIPNTSPVAYNEYITGEQFDQAQNPVWFSLDLVVEGWKEMVPFLFNSGTSSFDPSTGVISYDNFGAGVFFLPSALGYYSASGTIPAYSPMVFSVKLMHVNRVDHDFDGIDSYLEDLNGDGKFTVKEGVDIDDDDTDDDGRPDYKDQDDDGDSHTTKEERSYVNPLDPAAVKRYYPYNGIGIDDPSTPFVDETKGIPSCSNDFTTPTRLRKHMDKTCH